MLKVITHAGVFHADEVATVAWLRLIHGAESISVERVTEVTLDMIADKNAMIVDIGSGRYDHHQQNAEIRDNDVPYASFGLVVRDTWNSVFSTKFEYQTFDAWVQIIDAADNGDFSVNSPLAFVALFNPQFNETISPMDAFMNAVGVVENILVREIAVVRALSAAEQVREDALKHRIGRVLPLKEYIPGPWPVEVRWLITPSNRDIGKFNILKAQRDGEEHLPINVHTAKGVSFVHKGGFLAVFDTYDDAFEYAAKNLV